MVPVPAAPAAPGFLSPAIGRRQLLRGAAAAAGCALLSSGAHGQAATEAEQPDAVTFFRIGTGGAGGTYFPIGRLIASAISNPPGTRPCDKGGSCGVPGMIAVAQATQGSVENVALIAAKKLESGLCQADVAQWAYSGTGLYEGRGAFGGLRAVASLYQEAVHVVVRREDRIQTINELKGKRVSLGEEGSGTLVDARLILAAHGVREEDVQKSHMRTGAAADALRDGAIDAFFFIAGYPVSAIAQLADRIEIRLLPIVGPPATLLTKTSPFFTEIIMPNQVYPGVPGLPTVSVGALWVVSADLPAALVTGIARALFHPSARRLFDTGHPEARNIRLETARKGISIPLHPGAEAFYAEALPAR